jgi:hypothetical protein
MTSVARFRPTFSQFEVPVTGDDNQAVALHPADGLRNGGAGVAEAFGDACPKRHDVLFFKLQNGPKVHLRGVDQIRHSAQLLERSICVVPPYRGPAAPGSGKLQRRPLIRRRRSTGCLPVRPVPA